MDVIGILSDTHDCCDNIETALVTFRDYGVERIIHCGDVQNWRSIELFRGFQLDVVRGNRDDGNEQRLQEALESIGGRFYGLSGEIEFGGLRIFFSHGDHKAVIDDALESQRYDVVCQGHRHTRWARHEGKTLFLNPGAVQNGEFCILTTDLEPIFFCGTGIIEEACSN